MPTESGPKANRDKAGGAEFRELDPDYEPNHQLRRADRAGLQNVFTNSRLTLRLPVRLRRPMMANHPDRTGDGGNAGHGVPRPVSVCGKATDRPEDIGGADGFRQFITRWDDPTDPDVGPNVVSKPRARTTCFF